MTLSAFDGGTDVGEGAEETERSFSTEVKEELTALPRTEEEARKEVLFALICNAQFIAGDCRYALSYLPYLEFLTEWLEALLGAPVELHRGRSLHRLTLKGRKANAELRNHLLRSCHFDSSRGQLNIQVDDLDAMEQRIFLRALFISNASMADPRKGYHLEFVLRRPSVCAFAERLLSQRGFRAGCLKRSGSHILYFKEGRQISDILGLLGASIGLLRFEEVRVEREMNNTVNRQVNFDSANAKRVASSAARQCEKLLLLCQSPLFRTLDPTLAATAELRLQQPGLSITDLGKLLSPPLGKSGVYHRLRKLEELADGLSEAGKAAEKDRGRQSRLDVPD